jgi:hypothetical protein
VSEAAPAEEWAQPIEALAFEAGQQDVVLIESVLRRGALCVIAGDPKAGKSFLGMGMAVDVAAGRSWLDAFTVPLAGNVLYISNEGSDSGAWVRFNALLGSLNGERPAVQKRLWQRWNKPFRFDRRDTKGKLVDLAQLGATITKLKLDLVVIDTMRGAWGGKENDNDEMDKAVRPLMDLARRTDCAIVLIHHLSKVSETNQDEEIFARIRGGGALRALCDTGIAVAASKDHSSAKLSFSFKDFPPLTTATVKWPTQALERLPSFRIVAGGSKVRAEQLPIETVRNELMEMLKEGPLSIMSITGRLATKATKPVILEALADLRDAMKVYGWEEPRPVGHSKKMTPVQFYKVVSTEPLDLGVDPRGSEGLTQPLDGLSSTPSNLS